MANEELQSFLDTLKTNSKNLQNKECPEGHK